MLLTWDPVDKRYYSHGLDRGVLYLPGEDPIAWNGLQNFEENSQGTSTLYYRDGVVYLADAEAGDFSGKITAMFYPDEFGVCIGIPEVTDGLYADAQKPKRFGLSYRTLIGSGTQGDMFGYQIHLVYNCMATIGQRSRKSMGASPEPVPFTFDVNCTPVKLTGFRPSAHFAIDSRNMSQATIDDLEDLIYGAGSTPGVLPDPDVLFDMMNFGNAITVVSYADGTFDVTGSADNVFMTSMDGFQINNINA
ncbi:MAG TPA: hypothetical protein VFT30_04575, partial [Nitrospira sp.]|nr:hypothetical protein [Nitrospira sp.]